MPLIPGNPQKTRTLFSEIGILPAFLQKNFTSADISFYTVPYLSEKSLLSCKHEVFQYQKNSNI